MPQTSRYPLIALVVSLFLLLVLMFMSSGERSSTSTRAVSGTGPEIAAFSLTDQTGAAISKKDVLGRPAVLFFGFTFCPDVCPTTLASMTSYLKQLGPDADRIGAFFISVDPERDTPEVLASYLASFDPRIRGVTGQPDEIARLTKSLGIYHKKVDTGGGSYTVDHSALIVQLDSQGRFFGTIAYEESPQVAMDKLRRLAKEGYR
jgi:protein SCO1/2